MTTIYSLIEIAVRLQTLAARRKWWRRWGGRAAVAIILREGDNGPEVLMIQRAHRAGDRWSGHMAFPGGLVDAVDRHSLAAALRETREEIGLDIDAHAELIARLSELTAPAHRNYRPPLAVTPYVFALRSLPSLQLNHEVAAVVWIPLAFLADHTNRGTMPWRHLQVPFYTWHECTIWGLSLAMLDELLRYAAIAPGRG